MKTGRKGLYIFLIIFLSLIVLGLSALLVIGLTGKGGLFGFHFGQSSTSSNLVIDKEYDFEELNKVDVKIKSGSLKIVNTESEDDKVSLKFYADKDSYAYVDDEKDSLKIEDRSDDCRFFCINWIGVKIELALPKDFAGDLNIDTSYGDVDIEKFELASLVIDSSAGDVKIGSVKDVKASLSAGNFELGDCLGEARIDSSMGNVKIRELHLTKDSQIDLSMGNVEIDNVGDVNVEADTSMGDQHIDGGDRKSNITLKIDNSMGNITVR